MDAQFHQERRMKKRMEALELPLTDIEAIQLVKATLSIDRAEHRRKILVKRIIKRHEKELMEMGIDPRYASGTYQFRGYLETKARKK